MWDEAKSVLAATLVYDGPCTFAPQWGQFSRPRNSLPPQSAQVPGSGRIGALGGGAGYGFV